MIYIRDLVKDYDGFLAVDRVSFSVGEGEIYGLLGSNGAGKTTIFKVLTGLLSPTSGNMSIDGMNIFEDPLAIKHRVAYLPESPSLYPELSGREFLEMIADIRSIVDGVSGKIEKLAHTFELEQHIDALTGTYSKGMVQKLAFAAVLISDAPVLILDEPSSGLDPRFARLIRELLREEQKKGKTILLSTHITTIAESICDRVGIIDRGKLVAEDSVEKLMVDNEATSLEEVFVKIVGRKVNDE